MTTPPEPARRRSRWRAWLRRLGYALLMASVAFVVHYLIARYKIHRNLRDALARMEEHETAWKLDDIEAARAQVPDAENAAEFVQAAARILPPNWSGESLIRQVETLPANERLPNLVAQHIAGEVRTHQAALIEARKLIARETGRYPITYARGAMATKLPHQLQARAAADLLTFDALAATERGDLAEAVRSCRATVNTGRSLGDEPLLLALLTRLSAQGKAGTALERILAQGEPPPDELADLQKLLEKEDRHQGFEPAVRGERGIAHEAFDAVEAGDMGIEELSGEGKPTLWDRLTTFSTRDGIRKHHPAMLDLFGEQLEIARLPLPERGPAQDTFTRQVRRQGPNPATVWFFAVGKVEAADRRHHARLRTAIAALAAERYRRQHGGWPAALDDLKGLMPDETLVDPCDGSPLRLRRVEDGLLIYSVGMDGKDNGGKLDSSSIRPGTDLGMRLWDVAQRRRPPSALPEDFPLPRP